MRDRNRPLVIAGALSLLAAVAYAQGMGLSAGIDGIPAIARNVVPSVSATCQGTAAALNSPTTSAVNCTGVNFIVINYASANAASSVGDSLSNTYTLSTCATTVGNQCIYYKYGPTVSSSMTFNATGAGIAASIQVFGFRNVKGVALDKDAGQTQVSSPGTTCQTPSLTPTNGNELVISGYYVNTDTAGSTYTISNGMTVLFNPFTNGVNYGGGLAYAVRSPISAFQPTWTDSTSAGSQSCNLIATQ
jgi:hypothetical protein